LKLLNEIIETLSLQDSSLTDALLKTKVLLHKIGRKELVEWVNYELNGYPDKLELPKYRIVSATVLGNMSNLAYSATSQPLPMMHLDNDKRQFFETVRFNQSLAVLEKLVHEHDSFIQIQIPLELNGIIGKGLGNGYQLERAWKAVPTANVSQVFVQVRSRLLDFVLELQDQIGEDIPDNEIKQRANLIDAPSLFHNTMFGDNTTIIVGDHNSQKVKNSIIKNDFDSLAEQLKQHNVDDLSIVELQQAIHSDQNCPEIKEQKFGSNVKEWMKTMLSKVVDGIWEIEIATAGNLLSTAIQKYYGW
jgi:hypothetical protein